VEPFRTLPRSGEEELRRGGSEGDASSARHQQLLAEQLLNDPDLEGVRAEVRAACEDVVVLWKGRFMRLFERLA
jgi:hypothetical protein